MVTIEQKLSLFAKILQQDISNEMTTRIEEIDHEYKEKISESMQRVDQRAAEIVDRARKQAELKKVESISKSHMQTKRDYMRAREKQINRFMKALLIQIEDYTMTPEYGKYLEQLVLTCSDLVGEQELVVYMREEDIEKYCKLVITSFEKIGISQKSFHIENRGPEMLGGIIIENQKKTMRVDLSIATKLREQREHIMKHVVDALEEVGE